MKPIHRRGLRRSLLVFLCEHPDEWLTIEDAMSKWSHTRRHVHSVAYKMRKAGELAPGPELRLP